MDIKINNEYYNPLLRRKEISAAIDHKGEGTPQRFDIRKKMASKVGAKIENVFVVALKTSTGLEKSLCLLQVYEDSRTALSTVPKHIVVRNLPAEERARLKAKPEKAEKKAEAKPPKEGEAKPQAKAASQPPKPK